MLNKTSNEKPNSDGILDDQSEDCHLSNRAHKAGDQYPNFHARNFHNTTESPIALHCMRQSLKGN